MLDTGYWIVAVFYLFFIQLNNVGKNDHYLKKLGNKAACGFSSASIKHQASRIQHHECLTF